MDDDIDTIPTPSRSEVSSIGDGVSAAGKSGEYNEDDLYYVPERRPSLDLGPEPDPMDTSSWWQVEHAAPPALSYTSMNSEGFQKPDKMDDNDVPATTGVQLERTDSYSSCYSLDSDDCEKRTKKIRSKEGGVADWPARPELMKDPKAVRHPGLTVAFTFKAISKTLGKLNDHELDTFKSTLFKRYPESFNTPPQTMDMVDLVDRLLECYDLEVSLNLTMYLLGQMRQWKLVGYLEELIVKNEVRYELCVTLKRKYCFVQEDMQEEIKPLDRVFTTPYISTNWNCGPNTEHEVRHIETLDSNPKPERDFGWMDLFSETDDKHDRVRSVMTVGQPGSGKTMLVQKVIQEWAENRSFPHISFLFPLPFRELNAFEGQEVSLVEIIHTLYPETKRLKKMMRDEEGMILLVCDGLDEYPDKIDFNTVLFTDPEERIALNVLLINLLQGRIHYDGIAWVTTRQFKRRRLHGNVSHDMYEMRGFKDAQKEEYFRKRFEDPARADRVIAHMKSYKTLHIMCHQPLFCSVLGSTWERAFNERGSQAEVAKGITQLYTQLMLVLLSRRVTRAPPRTIEEEREFLMNLGKVALIMLEKGEIQFDEYFWEKNKVMTEEAVVKSGLCCECILEQCVLYQYRTQCFIHCTMQEYLAALYVFLSFRNNGKNIVLDPAKKAKKSQMFQVQSDMEMYKSAVEKSLQCEDGKLDIFLRFLFGMAMSANQELLKPYLTSSKKWRSYVQDAAAVLRKRMRRKDIHADRKANLQQCLVELGLEASQSAV